MAGVLEGLSAEKTISAFYIAYFGRAADPFGFGYWLGDAASGQTLTQIANNFAPQAETSSEYPFLVNDFDGNGTYEYAQISDTTFFREGLVDVISNIYQNLFGRAPTAEELAEGGGVQYWVDEVLVRGRPLGEIIITIANGASPEDAEVLLNRIDVAEDFVLAARAAGIGDQPSEVTAEFKAASAAIIASVDATEESVTAAQQAIADFVEAGGAPVEGDLFTLTAQTLAATGIDEITGTAANDTFRAVTASSLNTEDVLDGGAGTDTLNISAGAIGVLGAGAGVQAPVIRNIEIINNADTTALDLAEVDGVQQLWSTGAGATYTNASLDTTFGVRAGGTFDISIEGSTAGDSDTLNLAVDDNNATAAIFTSAGDAAAIENITISAQGGSGNGTTGDNVNDLVNIDAFTSLESIVVTGAGNITVNAAVGSANVETVDLSASTGRITVDVSASTQDVTVTGGSGRTTVTTGVGSDTITTGDAVDTITSGVGDDTITAGAGNDIIDAGAGDDVITGGAGADQITTGAGEDTVVYTAQGDSTYFSFDTIADFTTGANADVFDLTALGLTEADEVFGTSAIAAAPGYGGLAAGVEGFFVNTDGDALNAAVWLGAANFLFIDANEDGNFSVADDIVVSLTGGTAGLTADNFLLA